MDLSSFRACFCILILLFLAGCYHMRTEAVPIATRTIVIKSEPADAMRKIRRLVEDDWKSRILDEGSSGSVLITAPYNFFTDTSFGMPAGGRKYYTQLRIEIVRHSGQTVVQLSPHNFEMRSSYAYNQDERIATLYKHYPYDHYPGMFDLTRIDNELDRVAAIIRSVFQ